MALLVAERAIRDRRRGEIGWALGIAAYVSLMTAFYPAVQDSKVQQAIRNYPKELKAFFGGAGSFDFATGAGYLNVELFSLVVPALLVIVAIGYGARSVAGEEADGTLDFLMANPVTRRRVVLEKAVGLATVVLPLAAIVGITISIAGIFVDLDVAVDNLAAACLGSALLAVLMGLVAMFVGAATGSRAIAIGISTVAFAASYLIVGLAGLVDWLESARNFSPLYHANGTQPIQNGLPIANYFTLLGLCVAVLVATVAVFERRDLAR